mgnify:CR=1 FL=1
MSTLTRVALLERLGRVDEMGCPPDSGLVVSPILAFEQIGDASIDVRLGNQIIVFRSHTMGHFRPVPPASREFRRIQYRQVVRFGEGFVLHPGTLALGSTLEYVSVPNDLECQVEGRSSWARVGLQIATASSIEPGFKGVITLELSNVGSMPIELIPGARVAQLLFHSAKPTVAMPYGKHRKYVCPIGPQFSRVYQDLDMKVFVEGV